MIRIWYKVLITTRLALPQSMANTRNHRQSVALNKTCRCPTLSRMIWYHKRLKLQTLRIIRWSLVKIIVMFKKWFRCKHLSRLIWALLMLLQRLKVFTKIHWTKKKPSPTTAVWWKICSSCTLEVTMVISSRRVRPSWAS